MKNHFKFLLLAAVAGTLAVTAAKKLPQGVFNNALTLMADQSAAPRTASQVAHPEDAPPSPELLTTLGAADAQIYAADVDDWGDWADYGTLTVRNQSDIAKDFELRGFTIPTTTNSWIRYSQSSPELFQIKIADLFEPDSEIILDYNPANKILSGEYVSTIECESGYEYSTYLVRFRATFNPFTRYLSGYSCWLMVSYQMGYNFSYYAPNCLIDGGHFVNFSFFCEKDITISVIHSSRKTVKFNAMVQGEACHLRYVLIKDGDPETATILEEMRADGTGNPNIGWLYADNDWAGEIVIPEDAAGTYYFYIAAFWGDQNGEHHGGATYTGVEYEYHYYFNKPDTRRWEPYCNAKFSYDYGLWELENHYKLYSCVPTSAFTWDVKVEVCADDPGLKRIVNPFGPDTPLYNELLKDEGGVFFENGSYTRTYSTFFFDRYNGPDNYSIVWRDSYGTPEFEDRPDGLNFTTRNIKVKDRGLKYEVSDPEPRYSIMFEGYVEPSNGRVIAVQAEGNSLCVETAGDADKVKYLIIPEYMLSGYDGQEIQDVVSHMEPGVQIADVVGEQATLKLNWDSNDRYLLYALPVDKNSRDGQFYQGAFSLIEGVVYGCDKDAKVESEYTSGTFNLKNNSTLTYNTSNRAFVDVTARYAGGSYFSMLVDLANPIDKEAGKYPVSIERFSTNYSWSGAAMFAEPATTWLERHPEYGDPMQFGQCIYDAKEALFTLPLIMEAGENQTISIDHIAVKTDILAEPDYSIRLTNEKTAQMAHGSRLFNIKAETRADRYLMAVVSGSLTADMAAAIASDPASYEGLRPYTSQTKIAGLVLPKGSYTVVAATLDNRDRIRSSAWLNVDDLNWKWQYSGSGSVGGNLFTYDEYDGYQTRYSSLMPPLDDIAVNVFKSVETEGLYRIYRPFGLATDPDCEDTPYLDINIADRNAVYIDHSFVGHESSKMESSFHIASWPYHCFSGYNWMTLNTDRQPGNFGSLGKIDDEGTVTFNKGEIDIYTLYDNGYISGRSMPLDGETFKINLGKEASIDRIVDDTDANAETAYYNLQGIRVGADCLTPGIYVKVTGAKAEKVIVK